MVNKTNTRIKKISCEFEDESLEKDFFNKKITKDSRSIKTLIIILILGYTCFIIPDYMVLGESIEFNKIFVIRVITNMILLVLYYFIDKVEDQRRIIGIITVGEITIFLSYFLVINSYGEWNYYIKLFDLIIFALMIYVLPNKIITKLILASLISIGFFVFAYNSVAIGLMDYISGIIYLVIIHTALLMFSYRINYQDRVKYLDDLELEYLSETDNLTEIYNRTKLDNELKKWIKYKKRYDIDLSIIFFDFDNFKAINDRYGHIKADNILKNSVKEINKTIRETDIFGRWGGDEFVIILPGTSKNEGVKLAQRIRKIISTTNKDIDICVTCSFGVSGADEKDDIHRLLERADSLMYKAKEAGRDKIIS